MNETGDAQTNEIGESQAARDAKPRKTMSQTISALLLRNLHDVFGEIDPVRRRAAIDEIFHEGAVFYEPNGAHRGRDEIDRIAGVIKATHPDFQYQPISPPEEMGDGGRVRWVSGSLASRQLTPELISWSSGTARLPQSICSLTNFLEPDTVVGDINRAIAAVSHGLVSMVVDYPLLPLNGPRRLRRTS